MDKCIKYVKVVDGRIILIVWEQLWIQEEIKEKCDLKNRGNRKQMRTKSIIFIIIALGLGLGFNVVINMLFWTLLFRGTYVITFHANLYNEFALEFIYFNICIVIIIIALILMFKELGKEINRSKI